MGVQVSCLRQIVLSNRFINLIRVKRIGAMMAKALGNGGAGKVYILGRRQASLESVASQAVGIPFSFISLLFNTKPLSTDYPLLS